MKLVTLRGDADKPYRGTDPAADVAHLTIAPGETVEVSDAKAEQLLGDFPHDFTADASRTPATRRPSSTPSDASRPAAATTAPANKRTAKKRAAKPAAKD